MTCHCDGGAYFTDAENTARSPFLVTADCPIHGEPEVTGTALIPFDAFTAWSTAPVHWLIRPLRYGDFCYPYITQPFPCLAVWDIVTPDEENPLFVYYRDHKCGKPTGHTDSHVCSICGGSWRNRRLW